MEGARTCFVIAMVGVIVTPGFARDFITITADDRGWYRSDGASDGGPALANYAAGTNISNEQFRNWFLFDLDAIDGDVTSVTLRVGMPNGQPGNPISGGYRSRDSQEWYQTYAVDTPADVLAGGNGGLDAFDDIGSGTTYGRLLMSEADEGDIVSIDLGTAAVSHMNAAIRAGDRWAVGGRLASASPNGINEIVFAGSHTVPAEDVFIEVEYVPAPASVAVLLAGIAIRRRRRRRP